MDAWLVGTFDWRMRFGGAKLMPVKKFLWLERVGQR